jgi:hypothetical protein
MLEADLAIVPTGPNENGQRQDEAGTRAGTAAADYRKTRRSGSQSRGTSVSEAEGLRKGDALPKRGLATTGTGAEYHL